MRKIQIKANSQTQQLYDYRDVPLENMISAIRLDETLSFEVQVIADINENFTGYSTDTVAANAKLDFIKFDYDGSATLAKEIEAGAQTEIYVLAGVEKLKDGQIVIGSETIDYTNPVECENNFVLTIDHTFSADVANGTDVTIKQAPIVYQPTVDVSNKDTGLFTFDIAANTLNYINLVNGEEQIENVAIQLTITNENGNSDIYSIPIMCLNASDNSLIPTDNLSEFYNKTEIDALIAGRISVNVASDYPALPTPSGAESIPVDVGGGVINYVTVSQLGGGSGGEANTASNLGSGNGVFAQKAGVDLQFKSIQGAGETTVTSDGSTITVSSTSSGITEVTSDSSLSGNGTVGSPLSVTTQFTTTEKSKLAGIGTGANLQDIIAGSNIIIDKADAQNPIISAIAGGTGDVVGPVSSADGNLTGFDGTTGKVVKDLGFAISMNSDFKTLNLDTGLGITIKAGIDDIITFYNDTGATIPAGKIMHLVSATLVGSQILPTFEYADASNWEKIQGTLGMSCCDIPNATTGILFSRGWVTGIDTSGVSAGSQLWISTDGSGDFTDIKPAFANYPISIGGSANSQASPNGEILLNITGSYTDTFNDAWDGAIRETFDFRVTSNGTVVTGTLKNQDTIRDLNLLYSDGPYRLDTTTADLTVELVAGLDSISQTNYVFIPISTKVLTVSTTSFPDTEHCKVAQLEIQSAATTQTKGGALRNQNINDHIKKEGDNGHILHIAERVRQFNAEWNSGCEATLSGLTSNVYVQVTSGQVWQMHKQTFPSFDTSTGDDIHIVNDETTPYLTTSDLGTITTYSDGSSWNNDWSNIVIWGVANKTGEVSHIMCNKPSDGYNTEQNAIEDRSNFTDYSIPDKFKGVGFLIGRFTIYRSGASTTYNSSTGYKDLRGFYPNNTVGGGGGGSGVTTFLGLEDTPSSFTGQQGKVPVVNLAETDLEFDYGRDIVNKYNYIVNPNWDIAQEATSGSTTGFKGDMWQDISGGTQSWSITTADATIPVQKMLTYTGSNGIAQATTQKVAQELKGQFVTFSLYVKSSTTGLNLKIQKQNSVEGGLTGGYSDITGIGESNRVNGTGGGVWQRIQVTYTFPNSTEMDNGLVLELLGSDGTNAISMTGARLEIGDIATNVTAVDGDLELHKTMAQFINNFIVVANTITDYRAYLLPVRLRANPSITITIGAGTGAVYSCDTLTLKQEVANSIPSNVTITLDSRIK